MCSNIKQTHFHCYRLHDYQLMTTRYMYVHACEDVAEAIRVSWEFPESLRVLEPWSLTYHHRVSWGPVNVRSHYIENNVWAVVANCSGEWVIFCNSKNKHERINSGHGNTHIVFVSYTTYGQTNDDEKDDLHTSTLSLTRSVYVVLMTTQSIIQHVTTLTREHDKWYLIR